MAMTLKERLIHARTESGFHEPADAARRAGITPSALYQLESGKTRSLKASTANALAKVYVGFRIEWLISGVEPRHVDASRRPQRVGEDADNYPVSAFENPAGYVRIPLLHLGGMQMRDDADGGELNEVVQYLDVAEWWAQHNLPKPIDAVKVVTSRGDSNSPLINNGDIVFVNTTVKRFDGEGLYVLDWQGRALIRRLVANMRSGKLQVVSANPAYPAEELDPGEIDQLNITGRVAAWYALRQF